MPPKTPEWDYAMKIQHDPASSKKTKHGKSKPGPSKSRAGKKTKIKKPGGKTL